MINRFFLTAFIVFVLDQFTKISVMRSMTLNQDISVIGTFFQISYTTNTGAAFGILQNQSIALAWFALIIVGFVLYNYDKINKKNDVSAGLILGGVMGNLIDRISYGHIVDFLNFSFWPSFNIADSALTIGIVWLIFILGKKD